MNVRRIGPNQWEIFQTVPNPSGLSSAPPVDEVLLTLTDADVANVLNGLEMIDQADGSLTTLMKAHAANAALVPAAAVVAPPVVEAPAPVAVPLDVVAERVATAEGMPEPPSQV